MRHSLWNRAPTQTTEDRRLSLVLLGSLPSGEKRIVSLRSQLSAHLFGPGIVTDIMTDATISSPTVTHFAGEYVPSADSVCVGAGMCSLTLSPWSCPVPPESYSAAEATSWIRCMNNSREWLQHLNGKRLECNCERPPQSCWAQLLVDEFDKFFEGRGFESDFTDDGSSIDFGGSEDERQTIWPREFYSITPDQVGIELDQRVPSQVPWPSSWVELVRVVRALDRPSFWEIFSGTAILTGEFAERGICCAPPLDVANNPDFNLLNCMFLAVVLGYSPRISSTSRTLARPVRPSPSHSWIQSRRGFEPRQCRKVLTA